MCCCSVYGRKKNYLSETVDVGVAAVAAVVAAAVGVDVVVVDVFASAFRVVNGGVHDSS